jgi:putative ABC transport system permease protein
VREERRGDVLLFRPLPWDYGVRNLFRRPARSLLTLAGLATVVFLVVLVVAFVRGLDGSLATSGDAGVVLVHALGAAENIENSTVPGRTADLLAASVPDVHSVHGVKAVSPELYAGTEVGADGLPGPGLGLVRGVTIAAPLVRSSFQIIEGNWPGPGGVLVGRLAAAKLGCAPESLAVGREVRFEGRSWRVSGRFAARGSAFESELWCPADDLQQAMKRQDYALVAVAVRDADAMAGVEEFCKERLDLELEATPERAYYAALQKHYGPVRTVAWLVAALVAGAGAFAGLNAMYGAVAGRVKELAMLQTLGFQRRAVALSLVQEATLLGAAGALVAVAAALVLLEGAAVRFTMGAFTLRVDGVAVFAGLAAGLVIGVVGALPPAVKAMRMPVVDGLKAI